MLKSLQVVEDTEANPELLQHVVVTIKKEVSEKMSTAGIPETTRPASGEQTF